MIKFYGYSKWTTARKAKAWLEDNNLKFEFVDLIKNPPSKEDLKNMLEASGEDVDIVFNSRGTKYKELNLKETINIMSLDEKLDLLSSDGKLIKRPLLFDGKNILPGFKEDLYKDNLL